MGTTYDRRSKHLAASTFDAGLPDRVVPRAALWLVALTAFGSVPSSASAATTNTETRVQADGGQLLAETLKSGLAQLDSEVYADRRAASQLLSSLGKDAIPALAEVGLSGSAEASRRAIEILARHASSRQTELQEEAIAALEAIAASGASGAAMNARQSLRQVSPAQNPFGGPQAGQPAAARLQPRRIAPGQLMPGMPMPGLNGAGAAPVPMGKRAVRRTVQVEKNGARVYDTDDGTQHVIIRQQPGGELELEVTIQQAAAPVKKQFRAKSVEELKRNPEAGRLYDAFGPQWNVQAAAGNATDARQALLRVQTFLDDRIERTKAALRITDNPAHAESLRRELDRYAEQKQRYQELERQWRAQE